MPQPKKPKATLTQRQKAYNTIAPTGGVDFSNYYRYIFNIPRDTANININDPNEKAWKQYLGLAEDQFPIANYGYYGVKTPGEKVYKLDPEAEKDLFQTLTQKMKGVQGDTSFTMNEVEVNPKKYPIEKLSPYSVLQNFTVSKGKDAKGTYVAYGDSYDFDSFLPPVKDVLENLGTPYKFYNRYYYPEVKNEMGKPLKYGDPKYNQFYGPSNFEKYYRPLKGKGGWTGYPDHTMYSSGMERFDRVRNYTKYAGGGPLFDTGVQKSDNTRTTLPQQVKNLTAAREFQSDLRSPRVTEAQFKSKHGISREDYRNRPSNFDVSMNQIWQGAKEPFKFIGADPDLIRENPAAGIPQAISGSLLMEIPVGEMYQTGKAGLKAAGKALGTESGLLSNTWKLNPWADKKIPWEKTAENANKSFRAAGLDALEDFQNTGVLRSRRILPENATFADKVKARTTGFPSFQKGYADLHYLPKEGGVIFETSLPTFKRGEINPVTGKPIKGSHYAHRVINPETGGIVTQIPASEIRAFRSKPHWLKGYKEIGKPTLKKAKGGKVTWQIID